MGTRDHGCSEVAWRQSVCEYLNHVVKEMLWADRLDLFNHCPHFPFFMTNDEAEDEAEVCVLCCQKRSTIKVCGEYEKHYCAECIDTHTCGTNYVC